MLPHRIPFAEDDLNTMKFIILPSPYTGQSLLVSEECRNDNPHTPLISVEIPTETAQSIATACNMQHGIVERIFNILTMGRFERWYCTGGNFDKFIRGEYPEGDHRQPTKEQILKDIEDFFFPKS
jgi:hypothetical protein